MLPIPTAIVKGFHPSTAYQRNPLFTHKMPVVCVGFAVRAGLFPPASRYKIGKQVNGAARHALTHA